MKKFSLFTLFAFAMSFVACLFAGCSDTTAMGTSEEGNEFAEYVSSSSEESSSSEKLSSEKLSSSAKSSSSLAKSSSSFTASEPEMSSSSVKLMSSSSEKENNNQSRSSSSVRDVQIPISSSSSVVRSSSSEDPPNPQEGTAKPTTLDSYLDQFKLQSGSFDDGVLSAKIDNGKVSTPYEGDKPPTSAVEPENAELYRFEKKNIGELEGFFPTAAKKYAEIVSAIKNGSVESDCGLYMLSIVGNKKVAGFVLAGIARDSLTLFDIPAGSCPSTAGKMSQFLFYYCGELIREPKIVHVPVEDNLSTTCADVKTQTEWVKGSSLTP